VYDRVEWECFLDGASRGEFDDAEWAWAGRWAPGSTADCHRNSMRTGRSACQRTTGSSHSAQIALL